MPGSKAVLGDRDERVTTLQVVRRYRSPVCLDDVVLSTCLRDGSFIILDTGFNHGSDRDHQPSTRLGMPIAFHRAGRGSETLAFA